MGCLPAVLQAIRVRHGLAEEAIGMAPDLPDGHTALGRALLCHDHPDAVQDAREVLEHALRIDPEHDPAEVGVATILREQGQTPSRTRQSESRLSWNCNISD